MHEKLKIHYFVVIRIYMKTKIVALIACVSVLSSCGAVQQAQLQSAAGNVQAEIQQSCLFLSSASQKESNAWLRAKAPVKNCEKGVTEPWPRDKTMDISACGEQVMKEIILPSSFSEKEFSIYLKDRKVSHQAYADGKVEWDEVQAGVFSRMQSYFDKSRQEGNGSYYNWAQCRNQAFRNHIPPSFPAWPDLNAHLAAVSAFARSADKNKMAPTDFDVEMQRMWAEYSAQEASSLRQVQAANAAAWRDWGTNMQQYSVESQKAAQQRQSQIKTTNCTFVGNMMQCTEF